MSNPMSTADLRQAILDFVREQAATARLEASPYTDLTRPQGVTRWWVIRKLHEDLGLPKARISRQVSWLLNHAHLLCRHRTSPSYCALWTYEEQKAADAAKAESNTQDHEANVARIQRALEKAQEDAAYAARVTSAMGRVGLR